MDWIFLSPHFDDVAFSCGGLVWELKSSGQEVEIWTICAGDIPTGDLSSYADGLHKRWGVGREAVSLRRMEDITSCRVLGAGYRHFNVPDCIYRKSRSGDFIYMSDDSLFGELHPDDRDWIRNLVDQLVRDCTPGVKIVSPFGIGNHVDHQLTRSAARQAFAHLLYYPDIPYVLKNLESVRDMVVEGWEETLWWVSEKGAAMWVKSAQAHKSQISSFWTSSAEMRLQLNNYRQKYGGIRLWQAGES